MPPSYFPLRWESTGDKWWYAYPIDWAAANGLYELVRELLHLDSNLLIKLTSLRRIRNLDNVWDDEVQFEDVAKCRSHVARKLLLDYETKKGQNSLIRAGYGGWLLYSAASAGDVDFLKELLERDPLLVFGGGEYGITEIFYGAATSKNSEAFRLLLDFAFSPRGEFEVQLGNIGAECWGEMMNRAVHAAARGGNLEMLRLLLSDCSDVLMYRDVQGSTILNTASGRGQVEVVKDLVASYDIITSTDNQGNTALHVAAYMGYLPVVEALILASPSLTSLKNNYGDTFLHMAVDGFRTPSFRRLDRHIGLMKQLLCGKIMNMEDIINVRNSGGRTVLHMAVTENIQSNLVELLMNVPSIDLNIQDANGMTPLDILKQRPRSASSDIVIKQLISAGGISNCEDHMARIALISQLKMQGFGNRIPGTCFRVTDAEILLCIDQLSNNKADSVNDGSGRLKILLQWPSRKEKNGDGSTEFRDDDDISLESSFSMSINMEDSVIPLRQKYSQSQLSSFPNNHIRTFSPGGDHPNSSSKNDHPSPSSKNNKRLSSLHKRLMNQYFCFGAQGLAVEDSQRSSSLVA